MLLIMQASAKFESAQMQQHNVSSLSIQAGLPCEAINAFKSCVPMSGIIESIPDAPGCIIVMRAPVTAAHVR